MEDDGLQEEGMVETALDEGGEIGEDRQTADYEDEPAETFDQPIESVVYERSQSGGAWVDLYGLKNGENVKFHIWQNDPDVSVALYKLLTAVKNAEQWKLSLTPHSLTKQIQPAPAQTVVVSTNSPAAPGAPKPPAQVQAPAQVPAGAGGVKEISNPYKAASVIIKAREDAKMDVGFAAAGLKWPQLRMIGTPESIAEQFPEGWTPNHFTVPHTYSGVNLTVRWAYSQRKDSNGQPYKDVIAIE